MTEINLTSKVWTKPQTQNAIKALRKAGLPVNKTNDGNGYELIHPKAGLLFKAMNGSNGYLVRYDERLFI